MQIAIVTCRKPVRRTDYSRSCRTTNSEFFSGFWNPLSTFVFTPAGVFHDHEGCLSRFALGRNDCSRRKNKLCPLALGEALAETKEPGRETASIAGTGKNEKRVGETNAENI